ncbi:sigma-70 family RNA polymerase sigma factor [Salinibacterium sp. SYSU T00001]|uniref:sigma-70 family RNA polymerase sigma factor n=1 Tax=Homoserinimonas sedimenticola TaxID=2986805 RepID=UPI002236A49E|nr:sigma-70 family RNA polymerase sigma factor [Salinibacterium sedimenticola]MCW4385998.1 sigma-70 family RNA polymerase sigma factor [Salinibacterium sedimenticola]
MSSIEPLGSTAAPRDTLGEYLRSIGHFPLLAPEEEVELARAIEVGVIAREYRSAHPNSPDDALLRQLEHEGEKAHSRFIRSNLRLVVSVAKRYTGLGLPLMDLIQEGNIGLDRAVKKYDYTKGFKFSTYATWWIRQSITRSLAESAQLIRVPVRVAESVATVRRHLRELEGTLGRRPSNAELALATGLPEAKIRQFLELDRQPVSLNLPLGEDDGANLGDLLEDEQDAEVIDIVSGKLRYRALHDCVDQLPTRDADVLRRRFGLDGDAPCTLDELSVQFGISRERVRQIEQRGLRALRNRQFRDRLAD